MRAGCTRSPSRTRSSTWLATSTELGIHCDLVRIPAFTYVRSRDLLDEVRAEAGAASEAGLPASFVTEASLPFPVAGAVRVEDQAQFHPRRPFEAQEGYMTMLVTVARRRSSETGADGRTVVVDYGRSDEAREALALAARRAGPNGRVVIVDAMSAPADAPGSAGDDTEGAHDHREQEIRTDVDAADLGTVGLEIELDGDSAAQALAAAARSHDADEIVVGSRGLGPIRALMASWWCGGARSDGRRAGHAGTSPR